MVRVAIYSTGRGENKPGNFKFLYAFQYVDQGIQIILKIHQWLFYRFIHGFKCSEMNNAKYILILLEYRECVVKITKINLVIFDFYARYSFHPFEYAGI